MALTKCKECGNQISNKAKFCPHCGHSKPQAKNYGCGSLIVIGIAAWIIYALVKPDDLKSSTPAAPKTAEQLRKEKVEKLFFMGRSVRCENWIKKHLKDPASFEVIETKTLDKTDFFIVNITYRAKNSLNGFVVDTGTCKLSLDDVVLEGLPNLNN